MLFLLNTARNTWINLKNLEMINKNVKPKDTVTGGSTIEFITHINNTEQQNKRILSIRTIHRTESSHSCRKCMNETYTVIKKSDNISTSGSRAFHRCTIVLSYLNTNTSSPTEELQSGSWTIRDESDKHEQSEC